MMKAVGALLLLCGCLSIGMVKVKQMDMRIKTLRSLLCALEVMEREMSFFMPLLEDMFTFASQSTDGVVRDFLLACNCELKNSSGNSFREIWNRAVRTYLAVLEQNDLEHVFALGNVLGKYDGESQQRAICQAHAALKQTLINAEADRNSRGKVYKTLSATVGVFLVILLL